MRNFEKSFEKLSIKVAKIVGSHTWFFFSVMLVLIWIPSGFLIGFEELWHLWISTITTILTFLMMSLLHASQSKWEKKIESMELKQEHLLKVLEEHTEKIVKSVDSHTHTQKPL